MTRAQGTHKTATVVTTGAVAAAAGLLVGYLLFFSEDEKREPPPPPFLAANKIEIKNETGKEKDGLMVGFTSKRAANESFVSDQGSIKIVDGSGEGVLVKPALFKDIIDKLNSNPQLNQEPLKLVQNVHKFREVDGDYVPIKPSVVFVIGEFYVEINGQKMKKPLLPTAFAIDLKIPKQ